MRQLPGLNRRLKLRAVKVPSKQELRQLKLRELADGDQISFVPMTPACGRAEFQFCPVWKDGKILEVWIYPLQQPGATEYFVYRHGTATNLQIDSWRHKGDAPPWHWLYGWCDEHQCMAILTYPPEETRLLTVAGGSSVDFRFER